MPGRKKKQTDNSSQAAAELVRGLRLGKYRLLKRLGQGGFSEVWKARDSVEDIWVALKIPHLDINGEPDNQSILREVKLIAQLRHRHIMPVKNADIINGRAVLATGLSARTLDDRSKPMALRTIISIISQVLDGLAYAHHHRLVHCDVTPGNIFLFPDGRAALGHTRLAIVDVAGGQQPIQSADGQIRAVVNGELYGWEMPAYISPPPPQAGALAAHCATAPSYANQQPASISCVTSGRW